VYYQTFIITIIIDHKRLVTTFIIYEPKLVPEVRDRRGYSKLGHCIWYDTARGNV
jgi:hypothetical protein